ncbi:NAD-dependent epimerase/dehydratase family protein [Candidatus Woesearchaeota archaeon]|nr:NAD-dependent epimerase/dehydratase family protein [Candidatus Woesearchaeota archaeon]
MMEKKTKASAGAKKVLVTGATGFIGSHMIDALEKEGFRIKALVRKTSNIRRLKDRDIELVFGDLLHKRSLEKAVTDVDVIFHLAGFLFGNDEKDFLRVNVEGTRNLLSAINKVNPDIRRFIYISSQAAIRPNKSNIPVDLHSEESRCSPTTYYGKSKLKAEKHVKAMSASFPTTIIRPSLVFGPRTTAFNPFFKLIKKGIKLNMRQDRHYSFIHVNDLVRGILAAAENPAAEDKTYFMAHKESFSWNRLMSMIERLMGKRAFSLKISENTIRFIKALLPIYTFLSRDYRPISKIEEIQQVYWLCDSTKAEKEIGFKAGINFEKSIKETLDWSYRQGLV